MTQEVQKGTIRKNLSWEGIVVGERVKVRKDRVCGKCHKTVLKGSYVRADRHNSSRNPYHIECAMFILSRYYFVTLRGTLNKEEEKIKKGFDKQVNLA